MTRLIVITDSNLGDGSDERAVLDGDFEVAKFDVRTEDEVMEVAAEADGLLVQWAPITERVMRGLPRLRAVVRYGIGIENVDADAAAALGIAVSNVDDYCLAEVAEHAMACVFAHHRRLTVGARGLATNGWTTAGIPAPVPTAEDPVGVAGFGRIGREVAARAGALGFPVHVWDPYVDRTPPEVRQHESLESLARAVNHLSLHIPSTAATRGLVDRTVLRALGPGGHLVNTARGALVVEDDLLAALDAGEVAFASLDVLDSEPPVGTSARLAAHPRTLVTPHIAYLSTSSLPRLRQRAAEILRGLLSSGR
jgi:D-3-phosphoglycerate dehydrogenase